MWPRSADRGERHAWQLASCHRVWPRSARGGCSNCERTGSPRDRSINHVLAIQRKPSLSQLGPDPAVRSLWHVLAIQRKPSLSPGLPIVVGLVVERQSTRANGAAKPVFWLLLHLHQRQD